MKKPLVEIHSEKRLAHLDALANSMLSEPRVFAREWLQANDWIVVPRVDSIYEQDAQYLAKAAAMYGETKCVAVTTEADVYLTGFDVPMQPDSITEFSLSCYLRSFLLFPESRRFAVLEEANYFFLIAGPRKFVRQAIGGEIARARAEFLDYAAGETWPDDTRKWLTGIASRYDRLAAEIAG